MGLKCVKGSRQDNVTTAPYSSSWLRKVLEGKMCFWSEKLLSGLGRHIQGQNELWREVVECLSKVSKSRRQPHSSGMTHTSSSLSSGVSSLHPQMGVLCLPPAPPHLQLYRMFPMKTLTFFVPQFPVGPQDVPSSGFAQQHPGPSWCSSLSSPPYLELPVFLSSCFHTRTCCPNPCPNV